MHLAWQSTLYVTNFPEAADDKFIRDLFGKVRGLHYLRQMHIITSIKYGVLFDIRWPSKKFKSTRRFCYVQYTTPVSCTSDLVRITL